MKTIDIYYHDDFDGITAAGILALFLTEIQPNPIHLVYTPIDYHKINEYFEISFKRETAVVDFPFHKEATWWFDHHSTSFYSEELRELYIETKNKFWDPKALSCPQLLFDFFKLNFPKFHQMHFKKFHSIVEIANTIDSAKYKLPIDVYDFNNPFIVFNKLLENRFDSEIRNRYLQALHRGVLSDFFNSPFFKNKKNEVERVFNFMKDEIIQYITVENGIAMVDYTKTKSTPDRYIQYLFFPDIEYTITKSEKYGKNHLGVARNPWKDESKLNIGLLLKGYGGGGRQNVGAILFDDPSLLQTVSNEIFQSLWRHLTSQA